MSEVVEGGKLNLSMFSWLLGDAQMEISNRQLNMGGVWSSGQVRPGYRRLGSEYASVC